MNGSSEYLRRKLKLNRLVRLHAKLCLSNFSWEFTLAVGTRKESDVPIFHIETLNLVFKPTKKMGGGRATPSACLVGGSIPSVEYDPKSKEIKSEFEMNIDFPAARQSQKRKIDPSIDTPGPIALTTKARIQGRFLNKLQPHQYTYQNLRCKLSIDVPNKIAKKLDLPLSIELNELMPLMWFYFTPKKELSVQPVFIAANGATPPTGSDFYPLLARANEIWAKCCIQFKAKCPVYVDKQKYRISTMAEAIEFIGEVDVDDAIEVFVVERLDPEPTWGGGATFASGTAAAKIITGDNQLPLNQNHLAHELGHVLRLGHPGDPNGLVDSCEGSVMEPSGFFADNPEFQCRFNCRMASNPLLTTDLSLLCLLRDRPDKELF